MNVFGRKINSSPQALGIVCGAILIMFFWGWVAVHTSFWLDELNWIIMASGSFKDAFHAIQNEKGPFGPLEFLMQAVLSKTLIGIGFHPHLAGRVFSILFSIGTVFLPFLCRSLPPAQKRIWVFWATTSAAISSTAMNGRPYSSLIFFSSTAFFIGIESLERSPWNRRTFLLWGIFVLSGLGHPYSVFPTLCLLLLYPKWNLVTHRRLIAGVTLNVALRGIWFFAVRNPLELKERSLVDFGHAIAGYPWRVYVPEAIHSWLGPGLPLKLGILALIPGVFALRKKTLIALWLAASILISLFVPILLNIRYQYFFAARQTFAAIPFLAWVLILGTEQFVKLIGSKKLLAASALTAMALCLGYPWVRWLGNLPPYVDIPRYRLEEVFSKPEISTKKHIIVLSSCLLGGAYAYSDWERSLGLFKAYARNEKLSFPKDPRMILWNTDADTCSGEVPEDTNQPELRENLDPKDWAVLGSWNVKVPLKLRHLECLTEINTRC